MKKIVLALLLLTGFAGAADAQKVNQKDTSSYTMQPGNENDEPVYFNKKPISNAKLEQRNQRKIYKTPRTKQKATPTGQQATGLGSAHANLPKNAGTGH